MYEWDTPDGGPCFFRPTDVWQKENPSLNNAQTKPVWQCHDRDGKVDENGLPLIWDKPWCKDSKWWPGASFDQNAIQFGGNSHGASNHNTGWSNQFALPYELGLYYNFTLEGPAFRPSGCPGIDKPVSEWTMIQVIFSIQSIQNQFFFS